MAITMEQASAAVGRAVVYRSRAQREGRDQRPAQDGMITRVGREYVFVRYERGVVAATRPEDLEFASPFTPDEDEHKDRMLDAREALRSFDVEVDR